MTVKQATAEIFMTAFRALPRDEQNTFLIAVVKDSRFREDIIDLAIATKRSFEKTRSFDDTHKTVKILDIAHRREVYR